MNAKAKHPDSLLTPGEGTSAVGCCHATDRGREDSDSGWNKSIVHRLFPPTVLLGTVGAVKVFCEIHSEYTRVSLLHSFFL